MRHIKRINADWEFSKDRDFKNFRQVNLPHTWNAKDGQDGGNDYYRGYGYYRKKIDIKKQAGTEYWLQFDAVAQRARIFINNQQVGHHDGGYSAFRLNITDAIHNGENTIKVIADNLPNQTVYPQKADFTFFGGITRSVHLIRVSQAHFALGHYGDSGIKITPRFASDQSTEAKVEAEIKTEGTANGTTITMQVGNLVTTGIINDNHAYLTMMIKDVHRWDGVNDPYLYHALFTLGTDDDQLLISFGCRTYHFDPNKGFILNGHPYQIVGAAKHEDYWGVGAAVTEEMEDQDNRLLLDMGGNAWRLAHYQHSDYEYQTADQLGILVWAEIPQITTYMKSGDQNAAQQLQELVCQNWNHASIICWTLSNEITTSTGVTPNLLACHRRLNDLAHQLDDSRLTCIANVFMLEPDSELLSIPDIRTYNLYYGWYVPGINQNEEFLEKFHTDHPDMMIGLSEYGADNNPAYHSEHPDQGDYTEEYAAQYHEHMLKVWAARPWLAMLFPWTLADFAADGREEGGKPGQNQKGLVTIDRNIKKDSYYIYKAYLSKQPFVHICGHHYTKRPHHTTIKVYSNQVEVSLTINGHRLAKQKGQHVFTFPVDLQGKSTVTASAGNYHDTITITATDQPVPEYSNGTSGSVTNWFDKDPINPNYYSINDSINDLKKNPQAAAIYQEILVKATSSFGDVAKASKMPPAMEKKMNAISLAKQLKMVARAFKPGEIEQYNRELQQIKKTDERGSKQN